MTFMPGLSDLTGADSSEGKGRAMYGLRGLADASSARPGLYSVRKSFSDVSAKAWHSARERPLLLCVNG